MKKQPPGRLREVVVFEPLESRVLYSADLAGALGVVLPLSDLGSEATDSSESEIGIIPSEQIQSDLDAMSRQSFVFVDTRVHAWQSIVDSLRQTNNPLLQLEIIAVDGSQDAFTQITESLSQARDLDAIHVIAHGSADNLSFGSTRINLDNVSAYENEFGLWGDSLKPEGDILFYGCSIAATEDGKQLLRKITHYTDADIAASVDLTGHRELNANWDLEFVIGNIADDALKLSETMVDWRSSLTVIDVSIFADVEDATAASLTSVANLIANPGADGEISLREAIKAVNADPATDHVIELDAGTYLFTPAPNADLDIDATVHIRGAGSGLTTIDANTEDRIFDIDGGTVTISGLTITNGQSAVGEAGGGIRITSGTVNLDDVRLTDNKTQDDIGGGIQVETGAVLNMQNSTMFGNLAGIDDAPDYKDGGAIYNRGTVTLERVVIEASTGDDGGAIHNHGLMTLTDVTFKGNNAATEGGAIHNHGGQMSLERVTFENNSASDGGAISTDGDSTLNHVTFSANSATNEGGGLLVTGNNVTMTNSTFVDNFAASSGGAFHSDNNSFTYSSSLFANNNTVASSIGGDSTSGGFNLVEDATFSDGTETDLVGFDPLVGPLQNNGGFVETHALQEDSPGIDAGEGSNTTDATGASSNEIPDIGAHEYRQSGTTDKIFWTDPSTSGVYRANSNGSAIQQIVATAESPLDIEVDMENGKIYWVEIDSGSLVNDGDQGSVWSANLDGSDPTEILSSVNFPTGIALDIDGGYFYLAEDGTTANSGDPPVNAIVRYDLDGSNRSVIASGAYNDPIPDRIVSPTDIEYDPISQHLYWSDRGNLDLGSAYVDEEIKYIDLSAGGSAVQLYGEGADTTRRPMGLTYIPGTEEVYWADVEGISNLDFSGTPVTINETPLPGGDIMGIQYHQASDLFYYTDADGEIRSLSRDLSLISSVVTGLNSPLGVAIGSTSAVSLPPVITSDNSADVDEGGATQLSAIDLGIDDPDTAPSDLIYTISVAPINGQFVDGSDNPLTDFTQADINAGDVYYQHDGEENTSDSFTYHVSDEAGSTGDTVFNISVDPQNDTPIAVTDSFSIDEDDVLTLNLATNDLDAENRLDLDSIVITTDPTHGTIDSINANGTVVYNQQGAETTSDEFWYTIADLDGATSAAIRVFLTIQPKNDPPVAVTDSFNVTENATATLNLSVNDTDAEGPLDLASIVISTNPTQGTIVAINTDGTVVYTHGGSEFASDEFYYTIEDSDGAVSAPIRVALTIDPDNDTPVAVIDSFNVTENATVTLDLGVNDTDAEGQLDLTSIVISTDPTHGTIDAINNDGTVVYTHGGSEFASDDFYYTIADLDGAVSAPIRVALTIDPDNDTPVAVTDSFTVTENATVTLNLGVNDLDAEGQLDLTSIVITTDPTHGTIDAINNDGTVVYTHGGSEFASDDFYYTIADLDGAVSAPIRVTLTIDPDNDTPVAVIDSFNVTENATVTLNLGVNDTDAEGQLDLTSIVISTDPTHGTIDAINNDGTVVYTHGGSEFASDDFYYTIADLDGAVSAPIRVTLTIDPDNDTPVAVTDSFNVTENATVTLNLGVNDTDAEGQLDLSSIVISTDPTHGTIDAINTDGTVVYTHGGSELGSDEFYYTIADLDGAVSAPIRVALTIDPDNDVPIAVTDSFTVTENATVTLNLGVNDLDAEGQLDLTSIVISTDPTHGTIDAINTDGTVVYTHGGSELGSDEFYYAIADLDGAVSAPIRVALTIDPDNDVPIAVTDSFTVTENATVTMNLGVNDTDAEGQLDLTSIVISTDPTHGTIDAINTDGTVVYTHGGSEFASDEFYYTIADLDGAVSAPIRVVLTIDPDNDTPVAVTDSFTVTENATVTLNLGVNDTDAEGQLDLSSIVISTDPTHGTIDAINTDGTVVYTHGGSEFASDEFYYTIADLDGAVSAPIRVALTIDPDNDTPVAVTDSFTVTENATVILNLGVNDTDAEGPLDLTSIVISTDPTHGTIGAINTDGTVVYTHGGSEFASDEFYYTIADLDGAVSAPIRVVLTIDPDNDTPVAVTDSFTVTENATVTLNLGVNDLDAEGQLDLDSIVVTTGPTEGTIDSINSDGSVTYNHSGSEAATDDFWYTIADLDGVRSTAIRVALTINPDNDIPVAVADTFTVTENETVTLNLGLNDLDAEDQLDLDSIVITTAPTEGTIDAINADGTVTYTHSGSEASIDSFQYTVQDQSGETSLPAIVNLSIAGSNDAPVAQDDIGAVDEGSDVTLAVLDNDSDAENAIDVSSIEITSMPAHGSVDINPDGSISYHHDGSETLVDGFAYTVGDDQGATSQSAQVLIDINPVNDAPVVINPPIAQTLESEFSLVLPNNIFTDPDNAELIVSASLASGEELPEWLQFNADTLTISADQIEDYSDISIALQATDENGESVVALLTLSFEPPLAEANPVQEPSTDLEPQMIGSSPDSGSNEVEPEAEPEVGEGPVSESIEIGIEPTSEPVVTSLNVDLNAPQLGVDDSYVADAVYTGENNEAESQQTSIGLLRAFELNALDRLLASPIDLDSEMFARLSEIMDQNRTYYSDNGVYSNRVVGTSVTLTSGFSIGYIYWLARGGTLVSSMLAVLPSWRFIDPFPVLEAFNNEEEGEDAESLETMVASEPENKSINTDTGAPQSSTESSEDDLPNDDNPTR